MKNIVSTVSLALLLGLPAIASDKRAVFQASPDAVFKAAQLSAQRWWSLSYSDRSSNLMSFVTGRSFSSRGMECSVTLRPLASGQVEVVMHSQKKGDQLFAFGAGDRIATKFFSGIGDELSGDGSKKD